MTNLVFCVSPGPCLSASLFFLFFVKLNDKKMGTLSFLTMWYDQTSTTNIDKNTFFSLHPNLKVSSACCCRAKIVFCPNFKFCFHIHPGQFEKRARLN
jgi:hypothetical protein